MLECVVNVSEGRDGDVLEALALAAGVATLLDVHTDAHHHRSVLTLAGEEVELEAATRALATEAVRRIDLRAHGGAHPRLGAVDVVPFVPLEGATLEDAVAARDRFAHWVAATLDVPCFLYGPERSLPTVRREAFTTLAPHTGPAEPHPTAGAMCVGARPVLVAYNVWLPPGTPVTTARAVARELRSDDVRALGLAVGGQAQVSCNLIRPAVTGPDRAYDAVAARTPVERAELVGLLPEAVLRAIPTDRWPTLDLDPSRTIEARLAFAAAGPVRPTPRPDGGRGPAGGADAAAPAR